MELIIKNIPGLSLPDFHAVHPSDRTWMQPILNKEKNPSSTGFFGTHFLWGPVYGQTVAPCGDRILAYYEWDNRIAFAYPMGSGPLEPSISTMCSVSERLGQPLQLVGVTEKQREQLELAFPEQFSFEEDEDSFDYMYTVEKLASLSGKKLQGKRNHCNRFERERPGWHYEPLTPAHFDACLQLLDEWTAQRLDQREKIQLQGENFAIRSAFEQFEALGFFGGVLFAEDRLVAFTLAEKSGDTADVHFEKADPNLEGAFSMINREFARMVQAQLPEVLYLNREEDMGLEGLRKAKQSYYPAFMLKKYHAVKIR